MRIRLVYQKIVIKPTLLYIPIIDFWCVKRPGFVRNSYGSQLWRLPQNFHSA